MSELEQLEAYLTEEIARQQKNIKTDMDKTICGVWMYIRSHVRTMIKERLA